MVAAVPDEWFLMVWFVFGHSGQRTSVKCAEAAWNYKVRGRSALKITCFFFFFLKFIKRSDTRADAAIQSQAVIRTDITL